MTKYRVRFEIDEEVEADNEFEAIELAIGITCGDAWSENTLTRHIENNADVEEVKDEEENN